MTGKKFRKILLAAFALLFLRADDAWALYRQPVAVDVADWAMGTFLVILPAYIFLKVRFPSPMRFRIGLALVILNGFVWLTAQAYALYISRTLQGSKGFEALGPLGTAQAVRSFLWCRLIPISVFILCLLSKQAKKMAIGFAVVFIAFCSVELGLNYAEINGYLSTVEKSGYQDFRHATDIRNYLSASGLATSRAYPKTRARKVLLAMLRSESWVDRYEAAVGLAYLKDRSVMPDLVQCFQRFDANDSGDQARRACAVTLDWLLSDEEDYHRFVEKKLREGGYSESTEEAFRRLEKEVEKRAKHDV